MCKDKLISKNRHQKLYYRNTFKIVTNQVHGSARVNMISYILLTLDYSETSQQEHYNKSRDRTSQTTQKRVDPPRKIQVKIPQ